MKEMKMLLCQDVIKGFSYSFSKCLLGKLKEMVENEKLIVEEERKFWSNGHHASFTPLASTIVYYLSDQIQGSDIGSSGGTKEDVEILIKTAEEFLRIFEETQKEEETFIEYGPSIMDLELDPRTENVLNYKGIRSIDDLIKLSGVDLLRNQGFGRMSLTTIRMRLKSRGLFLRGEDPKGPIVSVDSLSPYVRNRLINANIGTIEELVNFSRDDVAKIIALNRAREIRKLEEYLSDFEFSLKS